MMGRQLPSIKTFMRTRADQVVKCKRSGTPGAPLRLANMSSSESRLQPGHDQPADEAALDELLVYLVQEVGNSDRPHDAIEERWSDREVCVDECIWLHLTIDERQRAVSVDVALTELAADPSSIVAIMDRERVLVGWSVQRDVLNAAHLRAREELLVHVRIGCGHRPRTAKEKLTAEVAAPEVQLPEIPVGDNDVTAR